MLGTLRKHSRSVIIYVLFAIIIVVFVFTFNVSAPDSGCGGGGGGAGTALVTVGDSELDLSDLYMGLYLTPDPPSPGATGDPEAYRKEFLYRSTRFARLRGDPDYRLYIPDPMQVSMIKVRKVMDDLEETWLVSELAREQGLRVGPAEVRSRIVPDFSDSAGAFKKRRYENWVRYGLRTSLQRFEDFVRREILREKMIAIVTSSVTVSDREARMAAVLRASKREYEYLEINPALLADAIVPSSDDAKAFLEANGERARKHFEEHEAEYQVEPMYDFHLAKFSAASRRIMAMIKDEEQRKSLQSSWTDAKERADRAFEIIKDLEGPALKTAFEEMARNSSDDSATRDRGGRIPAPLHASELAAMDPAVFESLGGVESGDATGLVSGDDGYYLLLLDSRTEAEERTFEQVEIEVAKRLMALDTAGEKTEEVAQSALTQAIEDPSRRLTEVAVLVNLPFAPDSPIKYGNTGEIPAMPGSVTGLADWSPTAIPGLGDSEALSSVLKELTVEKPVAGELIRLTGSESVYVVRLASATDEAQPKETDIAEAREDLLPLKRQAFYREWYEQLRNREASQGDFKEHEVLAAMVREEMRNLEETRKQSDTGAGG